MADKTYKVGPVVVLILIAMTMYLIHVFNNVRNQDQGDLINHVATSPH